MVGRIRKGTAALSGRGGIFVFMRAQIASQIASAVDFLTTLLLAKSLHLYYVYATTAGSVCGGIVNCLINYKWTFKTRGRKKLHVFLRYALVWMGSIALNTWGTYAMTEAIRGNAWVKEELGHYVDDLFIFSKIVVSLLVGFLWNYQMQRRFVYKYHDIRELS